MNSGLIILLLVGIILMTANAVKTKSETLADTTTTGGPIDPVTGTPLPTKIGDKEVIYKYLPVDIDEFFRQDAVSKPSKLYWGMFNIDADLRT